MPHSYIFFDTEPSIHSLKAASLKKAKQAFSTALKKSGIKVSAYATVAFKPGTRFMLHLSATEPSEIQNLVNSLLHTTLGMHLKITYTLLGLTRPSPYNPKHTPPADPMEKDPRTYLVVYPFTKTIEWHLKPHEERLEIMKGHVAVGKKYHDKISQLLLYSYGIDDCEFIVSYECDDLRDFQSLVMELRGTEARRYTFSDTPIFTCVRTSIDEVLDYV